MENSFLSEKIGMVLITNMKKILYNVTVRN